MIPVGNRFVSAAGAMGVSGGVAAAWRGATVGILGADFDHMLIDVIGFLMLEMPMAQIIDVSVVFHRDALVSF